MYFGFSVRNLICLVVFTSSLSAQTVNKEWLVVTNNKTGQVRVLDAAHLSLLESYSVGPIEGAVLGNNGRLYYVNADDLVSVLDLETGQRIALVKPESRLLHTPFDRPAHVVSPDNRFLVLAHHDSPGNVAEVGTFSLSVLEAETGRVRFRIPSEEEQVRTSDAAACLIPQILFYPNETRVYELCLWGGAYPLKPAPVLRVVDLAKRTFSGKLGLPRSHVAALTPDGQRLYILSEKADLLVVDTTTLKVIDTWSLSGLGGPICIRFGARMIVAPNSQQLYFTDGRHDAMTVYAIPARSNRSVSRLDIKEAIEDVVTSTNGDRLYLLTNRNLICLDTADWRELARVEMDAVSPRRSFLWIVPVKSP